MSLGLVHMDGEEVSFSNTTTETEIFRFDLGEFQKLMGNNCGLLGPNRAVRITVFGRNGRNQAGTPNTSFKASVGTTTLSNFQADTPQGFPYFQVSWTIYAPTATNKQLVKTDFLMGDSTPNSGEARVGVSVSEKTLDLSNDSTIVITATMSEANSSFEVRKDGAQVEFL